MAGVSRQLNTTIMKCLKETSHGVSYFIKKSVFVTVIGSRAAQCMPRQGHGTSTAACTIYSPCYKLKSNKAFIKAALGVSSSFHGAHILGDGFV